MRDITWLKAARAPSLRCSDSSALPMPVYLHGKQDHKERHSSHAGTTSQNCRIHSCAAWIELHSPLQIIQRKIVAVNDSIDENK
jgi:hypothetical protein